MRKHNQINGEIHFVGSVMPFSKLVKPTLENGYVEGMFDTMMVNFNFLNLSKAEKKKLSKNHRQLINCYTHLNPFALNHDAKELISAISHSQEKNLVIKATNYGAYVCLAALYSGLLPDKKIEFQLEDAPIALFPRVFMKSPPKEQLHKVSLKVSEKSWLCPFMSLYQNRMINCIQGSNTYSRKKAA